MSVVVNDQAKIAVFILLLQKAYFSLFVFELYFVIIICFFFYLEEPKILLPRHLLKPVKVKVGAKLHVNVPYQVISLFKTRSLLYK